MIFQLSHKKRAS